MQFQKFPLVRIVFCFALGLLAEYFYPSQFVLAGIPLLVVFGLLVGINIWRSAQFNILFSGLSIVLIFQLGALHLQYFRDAYGSDDLWGDVSSFKAEILESPIRKKNSYQLLAYVYAAEQTEQVKAKALLYTDTIKGKELQLGDIIWIKGGLPKTELPANPNMFDYAGYLTLQRIHYQKYIGDDFVIIGHRSPTLVKQQLVKLRSNALAIFDSLITNVEARQIAKALVLGNKENLTDELRNAYANSGAMHVLAVSGLHVGLIYLLLSAMLKRLPLLPKNRNIVSAIISIVVLFLYALLTGLSPSVFRAFVMFGFFALARAINRNTNSYNVLAASALVLLLYDPYLLFSVGFQLSYLAVTGILYLYPKCYSLVKCKHWLSDKIWSITCLSLAAQIAVAPLSMYYFNQFPVYFLLTNLFIIPAAFLILSLGLAVLMTSPIPWLAGVLAKVLSFVIAVVNQLVFTISDLPFGLIENIQISSQESLLIYALIISLIVLLDLKRYGAVYWALFISVTLAVIQIAQRKSVLSSHQITVYQIPNHQAVSFRKGEEVGLLLDSLLLNDEQTISYQIAPNLQGHFVKRQFDLVSASIGENQIAVFEGKKILLLNEELSEDTTLAKIDWDLVLSDRLYPISNIKTNNFILNSNYFKKYKEDSSIHILKRDGFFSQKWK